MRARLLGTALSLAAAAFVAAPAEAAPTGVLVVTAQVSGPAVTGVKGQEYIARNFDTITHTLVGPETISIAPGQTTKPVPTAGLYTDLQNGSQVAFGTTP